ncbi:MAG: ABC transporter ATP-binding protein [Anaerolineales bacterium]|nr:MAG: ABC transporter ATP-binding protein [Anaerolineales bacterium]
MARHDGDIVVRSVDVTRIYRVGRVEVHALRGVNFFVSRGEFVGLVGRSGSGKTTLLNVVGGLDHPTSGHVYLFGDDISRLSDRQLTQLRRRDVGFVFQSFALMPTMSAFENVELPMRLMGVGRRERRQRVMECLELVGLTRWAKHRPQEMSGGQQQRVAIARALVNRPGLVLADEPTGELDSTTGRTIVQLFQTVVKEEGVTVIIASHDPTVEEMAEYTYRMADGRIVNER